MNTTTKNAGNLVIERKKENYSKPFSPWPHPL